MRVCCLFLFLAACHKNDEAAAAGVERTPVTVMTIGAAKVEETSEYVATLKSRRSITLQPQIDGQVTNILVHSGEHVQAGQAIMQIDPAKQEATVLSQQANHTSRLATLNYWKQQAERLQTLYDGGAVSKQELDQARSQYEQTKADADALNAQVREQEVQLRYFHISAPAAGVIGDIPVRVGDHVTPATKLTTLDQNQMLEAYISVPVERATDAHEGMNVQILDDQGKMLLESPVTFVSPIVSDDTQSVLVKCLVTNENGALRAGQYVRARLVWTSHEAPMVPMLSVFRLNGQHFAYVVEGSGGALVAKQRAIVVGEPQGNDFAVKVGLKVGERLIVSGVQKVRDGAAVSVTEAASAPTAPRDSFFHPSTGVRIGVRGDHPARWRGRHPDLARGAISQARAAAGFGGRLLYWRERADGRSGGDDSTRATNQRR